MDKIYYQHNLSGFDAYRLFYSVFFELFSRMKTPLCF